MILVHPKSHCLPTGCRATKRLYLAAVKALIVLIAVMLLSGPVEFAIAQDIFGRIVGTVTDSSGAAVPDAKVTIVDEATQAVRDVASDPNGYFVADELPVGTYSVMAEKAGFKRSTKKGNVLSAGGRLTVDLKLEVGVVTETVTVTATGDTVNTTSGEISTTITTQQVDNVPLNQRHYETAVSLIPGAALQSSGLSAASITSGYNNSIAVINGLRLDGQNWSVDGGWNLDAGSNNSVFNEVGIDFIREVDVQSSNYDAEFGRSASATVNVVTKSGGAKYHGGAFRIRPEQYFQCGKCGHQADVYAEFECADPDGVQCRTAISSQRLWMGCGRPHPLYPAERQAVFLCRPGVEEVSRIRPRIADFD